MRTRLFVCILTLGLIASSGLASALRQPPTLPGSAQDRSVDPVVVTGAQFPLWSAGPEISFREPQVPTDYDVADVQGALPEPLRSDCYDPNNTTDPAHGDHNCNQSSRIPFRSLPGRKGVPVNQLRGFKWAKGSWAEIPFQVDERFTRYLSNNASGFAFYSGVDQYTSYAFDREGYRFTDNDPNNPCLPIPRRDPHYGGARVSAEPDPIKGLDDNDEMAFMYRDTGKRAPLQAGRPTGITALNEVAVVDPSNPGVVRYAYVGFAGPGAPAPKFDTSNGYVRYDLDANAHNVFVFSESSYEGYGAAPAGPYCLPDGTPSTAHGAIAQRRPLDTAWVRTPRYAFRYDGRWLMTQLRISGSASGDWTYGPDVIDRWKARAFQQDPSSNTPCCGYEEEDTNWGGSSILMGERSGAVRTIRETWGADSSTNNVRRETFYRDTIVWGDALRVHVIPPLDGIYTQWDYNATKMTRYYNPWRPKGVKVDGQNDEVFGNLDDPCNTIYDDAPVNEGITKLYRDTYKTAGLCGAVEYHQSIDVTDPTMAPPSNSLQWDQVSGPYGSLVMRFSLRDVTPGGAAASIVSVPYYRDDSCFDDGTGTDPGPRRRERSDNELRVYREPDSTVDIARTCWKPSDGAPDENWVAGDQPRDPGNPNSALIGDELGDERYFQGDIGAVGAHILLIADSDNAQLTVPVTEIDTEQRIVVLPGNPGNVGEKYGRSVEFPLQTIVHPVL
jgi:hypothetical protein